MRHFILLALFVQLTLPQAHACLGNNSSLFFNKIPDPRPESDLIAVVSVSDNAYDQKSATQTTIATVVEVMKAPAASVKSGDTISMKYRSTSCGPDPLIGSRGTIIAKMGTDSQGRLIAHPYTHSARDHRIEPPVILPDGYDMRPPSLKINERIPENFAVILIGVIGTESLDFLTLDHSADTGTGIHPVFLTPPKGIVAIAIPVGIKQLRVSQVTTGRLRSGYRPNDTVAVNTPKLDIDRPGLYYIATLNTDNPHQLQERPITEQLQQFSADYESTVGHLKAINFQWPVQ